MSDKKIGWAPYPFGFMQPWHIFNDRKALCDGHELRDDLNVSEIDDPDWYQVCGDCRKKYKDLPPQLTGEQ